MKKRFLIPLIILGMGAVGTAAGITIAQYQNAPIIAYADEIEETANEETEEMKLQELLDKLNSKYQEIRDTQLFGTTIGAIVGSLVGALVSAIPAFVNRSNIKKSISQVDNTKVLVDDTTKLAKDIKDKYDITNENFNKAILGLEATSKELETVKKALTETEQKLNEVEAENIEIKQMLLDVFGNSQILVSLGISEEAFKKYLPKK